MPGLKDHQDAFGHLYEDYLRGNRFAEGIVERDDGLIEHAGYTRIYFAEFKDWPRQQRSAIRYARGRVLDIGCGAGRCLLYLQQKGLEAVGIDNSPLAVKVCHERGVKDARVLSSTETAYLNETFDTLILYGNNFGHVGNLRSGRWWLRRMYDRTSDRGRIIADFRDPYRTTDPDHLAYHKRNRKKGRMAGQARIRFRYKKYTTPWYDLLLLSKNELMKLLKGTGWTVGRFFDYDTPMFSAVIEKE